MKAGREAKVDNIQKFTAVTSGSTDTSKLDRAQPIQNEEKAYHAIKQPTKIFEIFNLIFKVHCCQIC